MEAKERIKKHLLGLIAWLFLLFVIASCSSAEKLIDRAIKKDPTIIKGYTDTVSLTRLTVDSVLIQVGDTVIWDRVIKEVQYDTIINYNLINIERKKTRQEIRKAAKIEKLRLKLEAKLKAQQQKYNKQIAKLQERLESRSERQSNRQESKEKRSSKFWLGFAIGVLAIAALYFTAGYIRAKLISKYNY